MFSKRVVAILLVMSLISSALAKVVHISNRSTNSSQYTLPDYLQADIDFAVSGSTLTLTVINQTKNTGHEFDINELLFNVSDKITGLTCNAGAQWNFTFNPDKLTLSGFGSFDAKLSDGTGPKTIKPGTQKTFTLTISGNGPYTAEDFTTAMSKTVTGDTAALSGAKFINPSAGTQTAYGVVVPEPITLMLLGAGGLALLRKQK